MTKHKKNIVPDFELWSRVAATVDPMHQDLNLQLQKLESHPPKPASKQSAKPKTGRQSNKIPARATTPSVMISTGLDRRTEQRLTRGKIAVDCRIDLHGDNLETARHRLLKFLLNAYQQGNRTALVITGKGTSGYTRHTLHSREYHATPDWTGRLRQMVPNWLCEYDFNPLVSGFQPAHPKHGGGGAFYVRIRNVRKRRG